MNPTNVIPCEELDRRRAEKLLNDCKELIYEGKRITWDEFFRLDSTDDGKGAA